MSGPEHQGERPGNIKDRYLVVRVPTGGPKAVVAPPCDFATQADAQARIDQIEAAQSMGHHTHLEIEAYRGDRIAYCESNGILY